MFLSYLALAILVIMIVIVVYLFIWVHDIPYRLAKKRDHPNLHAIHIACWLSLFTLHALWPFVFIWAIVQKPRLEVVMVERDGERARGLAPAANRSLESAEGAALRTAVAELQQRLDALERRTAGGPGGQGGRS